MSSGPVFNLVDLVARDYDATVAFYRRLGVEVHDGPPGEIRHAHLEFGEPRSTSTMSTSLGCTTRRGVLQSSHESSLASGSPPAMRSTNGIHPWSARATWPRSLRMTRSGVLDMQSSWIPTERTSAS